MGKALQVPAQVRELPCTALLDSGSMISTISVTFCNALHLTIHPVTQLLRIKGAGDQNVPYIGYVETTVAVSGSSHVDSLLLVVPDNNYNTQVPVVIGTNILPTLVNHLDDTQLNSEFWQTIQTCLQLSERIPVKSTKSVSIPGGEKVVFYGLSHMSSTLSSKPIMSMRQMVIEHVPQSSLPGSLVISPALFNIPLNKRTCRIPLQVYNTSNRSITIPAQSMLCQLSAIEEIVPMSDGSNDSDSLISMSSQLVNDDSCLDYFSRFNVDELSQNLSQEQSSEVLKLLSSWKSAFSLHDLDLGHTDLVKHQIKLKDDTTFKQRPRRIPPSQYEAVRNHIQDMLKLGVIRPSKSPFSSNIVLVVKKDKSLRFCIDLRRLNEQTVKDNYSLPRIDETLDVLGGSRWFSVLDLKSAYWQVELAEEDKAKTAFTAGPLGFYECQRMPFGLTNAPATFQRLIESCMSDIYLSQCLLYLDDIVVFSKTYEEHISRLEAVFKRLVAAGLKLAPSKCHLFQHQIRYLGHIVSENGVSTDPDKIEVVKSWQAPQNVEQLRKFLGFVGFYRRFMPDFAKIARPLHCLLGGSGKKRRGKSKPKPQPVFHWGELEQAAFTKLVNLCCEAPVLAYADFQKPFILHTDASLDGLGAVLCQEYNGLERPVAYASRSLTVSEWNYPAHKLEFLAMKWAIVEKFHDYVYGNEFVVMTDNNPLTYVLTTAKLDVVGHRWVSHLANYNFSIKYRPGKLNTDADALSRMPNITSVPFSSLSNEVVSACIQIAETPVDSFVETMCVSQHVVDEISSPVFSLQSLSSRKWQELQGEDQTISLVVSAMKDPSKSRLLSAEAIKLYRQKSKLCLKDQVLYRKRKDHHGQLVEQLVLPDKYHGDALKAVHDQMGHMGRDRTLNLLIERFFWPNMSQDVSDYVSRCDRCIHRKPSTSQKAPLVSISTTYPLELVSIDYLSLERSKGGYENILVIMDHFTRYAQAYPTKNQTAKTTARVLFDNFVCHYGFPARFHSDQGRNFMSNTIKHLCEMAGVSKTNTTIYHPMGNGQVERYNRSLLEMLGTLEPVQKVDWKTYVPAIVHAYNCTQHESTGYSPFYLLFGRQPRIPVDLLLGSERQDGGKSYESFVESLRERLKFAYGLAQSNISKAQTRQKINFDLKARNNSLYPGDRVLVRNVGLKGTNKLTDRWKEDVYVIVAKPDSEIPVYQVKLEQGTGRHKTLHRNLLLSIGHIPLVEDEVSSSSVDSGSLAIPVPTVSPEYDQSQSGEDSIDRPQPKPRRSKRAFIQLDSDSSSVDNSVCYDSNHEFVDEMNSTTSSRNDNLVDEVARPIPAPRRSILTQLDQMNPDQSHS